MNVLVLGASGLIGSSLYLNLGSKNNFSVFGTIRDPVFKDFFPKNKKENLIFFESIFDESLFLSLIDKYRIDVIINCIGITKHNPASLDKLKSFEINSVFPNFLDSHSSRYRLIHISSDCVFSGITGAYTESSLPDAEDFYGKSKAEGEKLSGNSLVLRTSTIGRELRSKYGLLEWFLDQENECTGYAKAIFSGFPTVYLAQIIEEYVLCRPELKGLLNISSTPISKFDLLSLIAKIYKKDINIKPDISFVIDRSLNGSLFNKITGFTPPCWDELIEFMYIKEFRGENV